MQGLRVTINQLNKILGDSANHNQLRTLRKGVKNMNGERMIIDLSEFLAKELDRYGEIIHDHEWTNGPDVLRNKTYLYDNKIYDVTRENGNIIIICLGGKIYD